MRTVTFVEKRDKHVHSHLTCQYASSLILSSSKRLIHAKLCSSSYEEEKATLLLALDWARANSPTERISVCSDGQSLQKAIQGGAHNIQSIHRRLDNRKAYILLEGIFLFQAKGLPPKVLPGNADPPSSQVRKGNSKSSFLSFGVIQ